MHRKPPTARRAFRYLTLLAALAGGPALAADKSEPVTPQAAVIPAEAWAKASTMPLQRGEIDRLVARELAAVKLAPAPRTTDEQFLRRVWLDLIGQLPMPADVSEFVADRDPAKRAKVIDRLLASEEYARHWARYWRDVIESRATAQMIFVRLPRAPALEEWFFGQLKENKNWAEMARAMLTAEGALLVRDPSQNGAAGFLLGHFGPEAPPERAAETARVFLGIQIQCAQCHDHPSDVWKRTQFHELAAFFARTGARPIRGEGAAPFDGVTLVATNFGEHRMPSLKDPTQSTVTHPKFLNGVAVPANQSDKERRQALANFITSPENHWFAAAYVNRIWGELMGQSFYQPIDDMGPQKEAYLPAVLPRLAGAFQGSGYDVKGFFRIVLNSEAYQRQIRLGESSDQHMLFAASYPTRLRAEALWQALGNVLGRLGDGPQAGPPRPMGGMFGRFAGLEFLFKRTFDFDASLKADEVEGSIPQALLLMNNPTIHQRIEARDTNLLARILKSYPKDDDAVRMLYLRTLARKPTDTELAKCRKYLAGTKDRAEAFEDILWALLNSTEFQTKR